MRINITSHSSKIQKILLLKVFIFCFFFQLASGAVENALFNESECVNSAGIYECSDDCSCDFGSYQTTGLVLDLSFSFLGFLASMAIIVNSFSIKEMREPPGDILLGFSIASALLCILWTLQAFLMLFDENMIEPEGVICLYISYADVLASSFLYAYNFLFFAFFYYLTRTSLKVSNIPSYAPHILSILGILIFFGFTFVKSQSSDVQYFGMSVYGQCNFKSTKDTTFPILGLLFYSMWPFFMYAATKQSLADCKKVKKARYSFLKDYFLYVACTSGVGVGVSLISLYVAENLDTIDKDIEDDNKLNIFMRLAGTILRVLRPLILVGVRLVDASLREYWEQTFWFPKLCCCLRKKTNLSDSQMSLVGEVEKEDLDGKKTFVTMMTFKTIHKKLKNNPFLYEIQQAIKVQVLYSILSSIHCFWRISKRGMMNNYAISSEGIKIDNNKMVMQTEKVDINDEILKRELPEMMREIQKRNYKLIGGRLTVHAPALFGEIVQMDDASGKLVDSLDLGKNYRRIRNAREGKGGKSGEFFFFSSDENLVIKTITDTELKTLLSILPQYVRHFSENPNSLIAKIYGIFTFERFEPYEKYNLILMKNVSGYPSSFIERKYDLKGSKYTRQTVPQEEHRQIHELKTLDLKDLDFDRFEEKIHIKPHLQDKVLKVLKKDAEFMRANGLIDYSLIVYIVDKSSREQKDESINAADDFQVGVRGANHFSLDAESRSQVSSAMLTFEISDNRTERAKTMLTLNPTVSKKSQEPLDSIKSTEENLYYNMGIIDYLNKYTWKKRLEVFWKKLITCNPNLELSAQHQDPYATRFINYMEQIIFQ